MEFRVSHEKNPADIAACRQAAKRVAKQLNAKIISQTFTDSVVRRKKISDKLKAISIIKYAILLTAPEMKNEFIYPLTEEEKSTISDDMTAREQTWRMARQTSPQYALIIAVKNAIELGVNDKIVKDLLKSYLIPTSDGYSKRQRKNKKRAARRKQKRANQF